MIIIFHFIFSNYSERITTKGGEVNEALNIADKIALNRVAS